MKAKSKLFSGLHIPNHAGVRGEGRRQIITTDLGSGLQMRDGEKLAVHPQGVIPRIPQNLLVVGACIV